MNGLADELCGVYYEYFEKIGRDMPWLFCTAAVVALISYRPEKVYLRNPEQWLIIGQFLIKFTWQPSRYAERKLYII